ncbi:hypothetical protein CCUS01_09849, partial [Colletotrichum cuscutae]
RDETRIQDARSRATDEGNRRDNVILNLCPKRPSHPLPLRLPRQENEHHPQHQTTPRKHLRTQIPTPQSRHQRARNRRSRQHAHAHSRKHHADARPLLPRIGRQRRQRGGEERLDAAQCDAAQRSPDVETHPRGGGGDAQRRPAVRQHCGGTGGGDEHCQFSDAVCEAVEDEAAEDADAVCDYEEVEGGVVGGALDVAGVGCEEEEDDGSGTLVAGLGRDEGFFRKPTYQGCPHGIERILQLPERRPLRQAPRLARRHPRPQTRQGGKQRSGLDEPERPHRPAEPGTRQHLPNDNGKHHAARSAPAGRDPDGEGAPLGKVRRDEGDRGTEEAPVAQADADPLREQELPVPRAGRGRQGARDDEDGAGCRDGAEVARVREAAGEGAYEEEEEDLDGADPGYVRGAAVEGLDIVALEGAKGVDHAPDIVLFLVIRLRKVSVSRIIPCIHHGEKGAKDCSRWER